MLLIRMKTGVGLDDRSALCRPPPNFSNVRIHSPAHIRAYKTIRTIHAMEDALIYRHTKRDEDELKDDERFSVQPTFQNQYSKGEHQNTDFTKIIKKRAL